MWLADLIRGFFARRAGAQVRVGDRLRATVDFDVDGLVYHRGPYSSGFHSVVPRGTVMRVYSVHGVGFSCTFDPPDEEVVVPEADRKHHSYAGVQLIFTLGDIGRRLERVTPQA